MSKFGRKAGEHEIEMSMTCRGGNAILKVNCPEQAFCRPRGPSRGFLQGTHPHYIQSRTAKTDGSIAKSSEIRSGTTGSSSPPVWANGAAALSALKSLGLLNSGDSELLSLA